MICQNCDKENPENIEKCINCGQTLIRMPTIINPDSELTLDELHFSTGESFGDRYQIIEEIGSGGMGKVYKAKDLELNITVALKMIKPQFASNPDIIARFKRELLLAREILHENVIRIHDLGEVEKIKYISMNYIDGNNLKELVRTTGRLSVEKTIDTTCQVCQALQTAHEKGIIHRDLKPQNIMLDKKGKAYVLDFGIARLDKGDTSTTDTGVVIGTPDIMSPEQIKGEKAGVASDIYSVGVIMYEMATGSLPFKAENYPALLYKHVNEDPEPPRSINSQIPVGLENIILKCMEKKPKKRFASCREMVDELNKIRATECVNPSSDITMPHQKTQVEMTRKKSSGPRIQWFLKGLFAVLILYGAFSLTGFTFDWIYQKHLDTIHRQTTGKIQISFPIKKNWLASEWEPTNLNGWNIYLEAFPAKNPYDSFSDQFSGNLNPPPAIFEKAFSDEIYAYTKNPEYKNLKELQSFLSEHQKAFQFEKIANGARCTKLYPYHNLENNQILNTDLYKRHLEFFILKLRQFLILEEIPHGLTELHYFAMATFDIFISSIHPVEYRMALDSLYSLQREILPFALSYSFVNADHRDISRNLQSAYIFNPQFYAAFWSSFHLYFKRVHDIEEMIYFFLKKATPVNIVEKNFLLLARNKDELFHLSGMKRTSYHYRDKLLRWKNLFSANHYFYTNYLKPLMNLRKGLAYIEGIDKQMVYIEDFLEDHGEMNPLLKERLTIDLTLLKRMRMIGKMVLLCFQYQTFGIEIQNQSVLGEDLILNDFTNQKMEIIKNNGDISLVIDEKFQFKLNIDFYGNQLSRVLRSLEYFKSVE